MLIKFKCVFLKWVIRVKSIAYIGAGIYVPKAVPFKIDIAVAH